MSRSTSARKTASHTFIEPLEQRQFRSASHGVLATPAANTVATRTTISVSSRSLLIGQPLTITIRVKPAAGTAAIKGKVELLNGTGKTGDIATLNHKGYAVLTFNPGKAFFTGSYAFAARYLSSGTFAVSRSKAIPVRISAPKLSEYKDGLQYVTVTAGKGPAATNGQRLVAQYTGFLSDGKVFDESSLHSPGTFSFTLYASPEQVIAGLDEGMKGMKAGETRVLVIPSALGNNDGLTRVFVVHLISIA